MLLNLGIISNRVGPMTCSVPWNDQAVHSLINVPMVNTPRSSRQAVLSNLTLHFTPREDYKLSVHVFS